MATSLGKGLNVINLSVSDENGFHAAKSSLVFKINSQIKSHRRSYFKLEADVLETLASSLVSIKWVTLLDFTGVDGQKLEGISLGAVGHVT